MRGIELEPKNKINPSFFSPKTRLKSRDARRRLLGEITRHHPPSNLGSGLRPPIGSRHTRQRLARGRRTGEDFGGIRRRRGRMSPACCCFLPFGGAFRVWMVGPVRRLGGIYSFVGRRGRVPCTTRSPYPPFGVAGRRGPPRRPHQTWGIFERLIRF